MRVKEELLDVQADKKKMSTHLTEASANIDRLKGMVTRSRTENARLEKALLQERSRRKDEEDLMKRELRQRTEKHQADAQSLGDPATCRCYVQGACYRGGRGDCLEKTRVHKIEAAARGAAGGFGESTGKSCFLFWVISPPPKLC